jgi:hypothetical protein
VPRNKRECALTLLSRYGILIVEKIRSTKNPIEKGKPFERMGHKALEPKSRMTYGCQLPKG